MHLLENNAKNGQCGDVGGVKSKQSDNITTQLFIDLRTHFFLAELYFPTLYGENKPFLMRRKMFW